MTCCTIREKFPPVRNWSVEKEKKTQARRRAASGPVVGCMSSLRAVLGALIPAYGADVDGGVDGGVDVAVMRSP
ncbi:hypothetical protein ALMP_26870 [Streptomyces sp. A012304]|nr:hypothetical protein ALMP_26870 [Streptomyces sp. A012304]